MEERENSAILSLQELRREYAGKWVVARQISRTKAGLPERVEVLFSDDDRGRALDVVGEYVGRGESVLLECCVDDENPSEHILIWADGTLEFWHEK